MHPQWNVCLHTYLMDGSTACNTNSFILHRRHARILLEPTYARMQQVDRLPSLTAWVSSAVQGSGGLETTYVHALLVLSLMTGCRHQTGSSQVPLPSPGFLISPFAHQRHIIISSIGLPSGPAAAANESVGFFGFRVSPPSELRGHV
jgi:hypothetical protein